MAVSTIITLHDGIKRIDIQTKIDNTAKDHRVRVVFSTGIKSDYSYAQKQFGTIKRSNRIEDAEKWKDNGWSEKPLPIYSQHKFVDVNDGEHGMAILNRGLTEYEIYDDSSIAVTLVRGVGYMGKADLAIRPGRPSGIHVETPDAQCIGEIVSEYSIVIHAGTTDEADIAKRAAVYSTPLSAVQNRLELNAIVDKYKDMLQLFNIENLQSQAEKKLCEPAQRFNFINVDSDKLLISCIKKAENEEAIILRLYNPTGDTVSSAQVSVNAQLSKVKSCNFIEQDEKDISCDNNKFYIGDIKAYSAKTYKIAIN